MPNYIIVPITEEHILIYREAVGSVAREKKYLAFLDTPALEKSQGFVRYNIANNRPHFVAIADNQVVGWCDISDLNRPVFLHAGCLGIGVINGYRGIGIGEALMRAAIQKAQQNGLTRIELTVRENNLPALALYRKLGFKHEGLHINAVKIDGKYENQFSMALLLDD